VTFGPVSFRVFELFSFTLVPTILHMYIYIYVSSIHCWRYIN
jgi:hypothetical protein